MSLAAVAEDRSGVIGATVVAFSTSSSELLVLIHAAVAGKSQIALGDALGSNMVNIALIVGFTLADIGNPMSSRDWPATSPHGGFRPSDHRHPSRRWSPVATRWRPDALPVRWVARRHNSALRKERSSAAPVLAGRDRWLSVLWCGLGLSFLVSAGILIVAGAKGTAASLGIDPFVIGATPVAMGESAPELATTVIAKLRGHDEVGLGSVLGGSNVFSGRSIVAVAACIRPIHVDWREISAALAFGLAALLLALPKRDGMIPRRRGVLPLARYAAYVVAVVLLRPI